jgi:hypothetical protein
MPCKQLLHKVVIFKLSYAAILEMMRLYSNKRRQTCVYK